MLPILPKADRRRQLKAARRTDEKLCATLPNGIGPVQVRAAMGILPRLISATRGEHKMASFLVDWKRTHHCNALRKEDLGGEVVLMGWVANRRDHGGRVFIDLRDREGLTQVVFGPDVDAEAHTLAGELRSEFCIAIRGKVV